MSPRYLPERVLPPYAFLPGRAPHPTRDPAGHSWNGGVEPRVTWLPAERWRASEPYLWGVDLYNAGFAWEAHEAWEGLWNAAAEAPAPDQQQRQFLQGLIQCAAACVKAALGEVGPAAKLVQRAVARLDEVAAVSPRYMGVEVLALARAFRDFVAGGADLARRPGISLQWSD